MTKEPTIQEMNKTIARFMELEEDVEDFRYPHNPLVFLVEGYWLPVKKLKYHSDWNWLMPVIEKISKWPLLNSDGTPCTDPNDTCYPVTFNMPDPNEAGKVMFRFKGHTLHFGENLIDVCFHAVYEAIQWYNENNKP